MNISSMSLTGSNGSATVVSSSVPIEMMHLMGYHATADCDQCAPGSLHRRIHDHRFGYRYVLTEGRRGILCREHAGLIPHDQPYGPLLKSLSQFCRIAPIMPVLPTHPVRKCCTVYNLRIELFHGME